MAHVFISYAHVDFEFAENLKHRLEKSGFDVWMDEERLRAGEDWREEIDDALRDAFAVILIMSPESMGSFYVMYEWSFAWGAKKKIIPILYKSVEDEKIHPRLDKRQHLDFTDRLRPWDKLFRELTKLGEQYGTNTIHIPQNAPPAIKNAAESLDSSDYEKRQAGIELLFDQAQSGNKAAIEALALAMEHPTPDVNTEAAFKLARLKDKRAMPLLLKIIYGDDWDLAAKGVDALVELGHNILPALQECLIHKNEYIRWQAARTLGQFTMTDRTSVPHLIKALEDKSYKVREATVKSLGEIRDLAAMPSIMKLLNEESSEMHEAIAEALGKLGTPAIANLLMLLESKYSNVRLATVHALEEVAGLESVEKLIKRLHDNYELVQLATAQLLIRIGTPEALAAVEQWQREQGNQSSGRIELRQAAEDED